MRRRGPGHGDDRRAAALSGGNPAGADADEVAPDLPYTNWWRRLVATIIDYLIVLVPTAIVLSQLDLIEVNEGIDGEVTGNITVAGVLAIIVVTTLYFAIPTARTGRTLGKVATGCRVVRLDGRLLDGRDALLRAVLYALAVQTCVLGVVDGLWALWDPRRQALHDKVVGTVVVDG